MRNNCVGPIYFYKLQVNGTNSTKSPADSQNLTAVVLTSPSLSLQVFSARTQELTHSFLHCDEYVRKAESDG